MPRKPKYVNGVDKPEQKPIIDLNWFMSPMQILPSGKIRMSPRLTEEEAREIDLSKYIAGGRND